MHKVVVLYKFTPFVNKSFKDTLYTFVDYLVDKYDVAKVEYKNTELSPDKCRIGTPGNFRQLEEVFVRLSFTNTDFTIVSGSGHLFCTCHLNLYKQIEVHWDSIYRNYEDAIEFTPSMSRKLKIKKINGIK